ncbi:PAS domain-containing protein [Mariniflexile gromovii]|uniref:histidine kinase n=1 Tax=Mariniflexile gromovii TaxID=362523 RepID=A0ABS4BRK3_9FLAO|nr:PAS domain-containing protein [Mariniflexile gromovii]MBP0903157.1 PAS domain-containing protein [Mariniflexile gromovii]
MTNIDNIPYFLKNGGEMGKLIRAKDWSKTPLGDPKDWPASLQTMVSVMLENPFGMYIAWGKEYTQIYNDGYRPILGATKHPHALGISTRETFSEIWHIIESMFDGVMDGNPVGFPDFMLPLDRNGYIEECYFDFAYSPIRTENGEVGGVLVTVIETTNKKRAEEALKERTNQLQFAIEATDLASWTIDPETKEFTGDDRLREWHGLPAGAEFNLENTFSAVIEEDREPLIRALETAIDFSSGGNFDHQYSIINPITKQLRIVRAKGKVSYNQYNQPIKFTGTLQNITKEVIARNKKEENERNLRLMILQAPVGIGIFRGPDYVVEIANTKALEIWGRTEEEILNKSIFDSMPELKNQGIKELLDDVKNTGNRFTTDELMVKLLRNGKLEDVYINFSYEPLFDADGSVNGIMAIGIDVTPHVEARKKIEESEQSVRTLIESAPFPIGVYTGKELRIAFANQSIMDAWGKGNDVEGKLYTDILPELENQQIFEQLHGVLNTGIAFHRKNQRVDLNINGVLKPHYFNYSFTPLLDTSGEVYGVMNTAAEVTELHQAKQKVEESEKRFRDSVEQAPLGIAIFGGNDYKAEMANANYLLLVDKKKNEFIGKPLFETLPEVENLVAPLFADVILTGKPFYSPELPVYLNRNGKMEQAYFNLVYHPLKEENGEISRIMVVATEVTSTVKAKHLLEESERHFKNMVMQSPIPMTILKGKDHVIESANTVMFENVWRKKEKDVIGKSILKVFPELNEQKYPELLNKVYNLGKPHTEKESVAYVMGDDGMRKFYFDFEYKPLIEPEGETSGIMITVNDVTDKVEARQKVEEAEARSRLAAEATDLATWELDINTRSIIHSPRLAVIFGHDESTILTHQKMRDQIHREDIHSIVEKAFDDAMVTGIYNYEARVVKPDNTFCWIRTQGKVFFDDNNKPFKKLGTLRDITKEKLHQQELQESELKFRLLADSMPQHIWTADSYGNLNYFNQSVYDYSGLSPEQVHDNWLQIVHPNDREANIKAWLNSVNTGEDFLFEHRFRRHDGEYRWQLSRAIPQRDKQGEITMWVGTSTDIQAQKMFTNELEDQVLQRTKELNEKNKVLEKMNKELQSFTYISSHDLQEPLRKIQILSTQIVDKESQNLSESGKDKFHRMQKSAHRMQTLIQDLLLYSHTDIQQRKFITINLKTIVDEVEDDLKEDLKVKNATINLGNMCDVNVIHFQFRQLLLNLASNSLKFAKENTSPQINISCETVMGNKVKTVNIVSTKKYCHITFSDNGIGFEPEYNIKIFEVFQRLHGKEKYIGTGIGLAIVKKIVENHNGTITATGELGKGARFDIYIPS